MPKPGPRAYECVRRAWHSDRHHPIRGSIIQQIFRMAEEKHRFATRKNTEWQEKLPCVVLKAEEIMYSKANSEAEYMDAATLWIRTNEAIDTIIRKDDAMESEELLRPCIEAALNLGCIPRRASRGQRHGDRGCYLGSIGSKEASFAAAKNPEPGKPNPGSFQIRIQASRGSNCGKLSPMAMDPPPSLLPLPSLAIEVDFLHCFIGGGYDDDAGGSIDMSSSLEALPAPPFVTASSDCDLSLSLGFSAASSDIVGGVFSCATEDVGSSSSPGR